MSEAGFDFNAMSIRMGMGQAKNDGGGDGGNEKDIFEFLIDSVSSGIFNKATKLSGIANGEGLLNTGVQKSYDSQGIQEKMINPFGQGMSAPGGFLYRILSALMKNSAITDHTQGIDGNMQLAGGGDYGGGGGGDSGGGGDYGGGSGSGGNYGEAAMGDMGGMPMGGGAQIEPMTMEYGGRSYEVASMSAEVLGNITPSSGASLSDIRGRGDIEIG